MTVDRCRFRLLGPVQVTSDDGPVSFPRRQQLELLALLLLNVDRAMSVDQIVDAMWGEAAPQTARKQIRNMVSGIRRIIVDGPLALATLDRPAAGYRLRVPDGQLDLALFTGLLADARAAATPEAVARTLRRALGLWQGAYALAGVRAHFADAARAHLTELRSAASEDLFDAELECGNHAEIVAELTQAVTDNPGRERLVGQLMVALYRGGRTVDALAVYQRARKTLTEEYGLEPGAGLRDLEHLILLGDPVPGRPRRPAVAESEAKPPADPVPAQLPVDVYGFVGRDQELARLDALLDGQHPRPAGVLISALLGTAGIGKTALAVHWAHRVSGRFPDGQLYVNLRGFDPGGTPLQPAEVVRDFLDALAVPPERVPAGLPAQVALYRSLVAGRRILVVLDNAVSSEQVRPLLPGTPGCLVLVTSRRTLTGLITAEGVLPITLDLLTDLEARDLLATRLGPERIAAEERAAMAIVTQCARLPLALAVVAARATVHPTFPLAVLSAELSHARAALGALSDLDPSVDVRTVFSWSYERLSDGASRLFRLLGLHPGPDVSVPAAASLAGLPAARVRPLLAELADSHLVAEHSPGRFAMHDLLRAYAADLAGAVDPDGQRREAVCRLLDHYLLTAAGAAAFLLYPHQYQIHLEPAGSGVTVETLTDHEHALAWFNTEHRVLVAAVPLAAAGDLSTHAWQLASTIAVFLDRQCHWHDWVGSQRSALVAAERLADRDGQVHAHNGLGLAYNRLGDYDLAHSHLRRALDLVGDQVEQGRIHLRLCGVRDRQGEHADALYHAERALDLHRAAGHRAGEAYALNSVGWCHAELGRYLEAIAHCEEALALHHEFGDRQGAAQTLDSIGYAYHQLGRYPEAATYYRQSVELLRETGGRNYLAIVLMHLGDAYRAAGQVGPARDAWREALSILDGLNHPDAEEVRTKLRRLETPAAARV